MLGVKVSESAQRAYLYTNNKLYLEDYNRGKLVVRESFLRIKELSRNPEQLKLIEGMEKLCKLKYNELDTTLRFSMNQQPEIAKWIVKTNFGKFLMDNLRGNINRFKDMEVVHLNNKMKEPDYSLAVLVGTALVSSSLFFLILTRRKTI
jgi:CHASE3 domain sensor protein